MNVVRLNQVQDNEKPKRKSHHRDPRIDGQLVAEQSIETGCAADTFRDIDEVNLLLMYFLDSGRWRDALMFVTGLNTTFRISDVLQLKWKHILTDNLEVKQHWMWEEQKNGKDVRVTSNDAFKKMVRLYIEKTGEPENMDAYIFTSASNRKNHTFYTKATGSEKIKTEYSIPPLGMTPESANRIIREAAKDVGIYSQYHRISSHSMRKTAATAATGVLPGREMPESLYYMSMSGETVSRFMRHSNISTTMRYQNYNRIFEQLFLFINLGIEALDEFERRVSVIG